MKALSELRARLIRFYNSADIYILPILKFVIAFLLLYAINTNYGYMEKLNNMFVIIVLSLICALLPLAGTVAISMIITVIHCFGLSVEIGAFAACLYLLLFILIIRFVASDSLAIVIAPFAFKFYVPSAVPVTLGMLGKAVSSLAGVTAVISYYFLEELPAIAALQKAGELSSLEILNALIDGLVNNMEMIITIIVFAAVTLIVYLIRKLCTTYGWLLSAIIGNAVYVLLFMMGSVFLEIQVNIMYTVLGAAVSVLINIVIAFFKFNAKYKGSRYLQFEDDDYYYYVKVIPKEKTSFVEDDDEDEEETYFKTEDEEADMERAKRMAGRPVNPVKQPVPQSINQPNARPWTVPVQNIPKAQNNPKTQNVPNTQNVQERPTQVIPKVPKGYKDLLK